MQKNYKFAVVVILSIMIYVVSFLHLRIAEQDGICFKVERIGTQLKIINDNISFGKIIFRENQLQLDEQNIGFTIEHNSNQTKCIFKKENDDIFEWGIEGKVNSLGAEFSFTQQDMYSVEFNGENVLGENVVSIRSSNGNSFTEKEKQVLMAGTGVYLQLRDIYKKLIFLGVVQILLFFLCYLICIRWKRAEKILLIPVISAVFPILFCFYGC